MKIINKFIQWFKRNQESTQDLSIYTIAQLRQLNWKVRVNHWRFGEEDYHKAVTKKRKYNPEIFINTLKYLRSNKLVIASRGGRTEVELVAPDGKTFKGASVCSLVDNFNRRLGIKVALSKLQEIKSV